MNPMLLDLPAQIRTPRLILRPPAPGDGAVINKATCECIDHLRPWMPWASQVPTLEQSEEFVRRASANWVLREDLILCMFSRENGRYLGGSGLHNIEWSLPRLEIGYWIRQSEEGRGYVTEAVNAITTFAFRFLGAKRIEIRCDANNARSSAVPERLGFEREALMRNQARSPSGELRDTLVYARIDLEGMPKLEVEW